MRKDGDVADSAAVGPQDRCRFSFSVRPDIAGFSPPGSRSVNRSWYNLGRRISLCFGAEITQDLSSMRALLLISLLLRCCAAFFRSRNQQAVVELALRQQLATYAQTGSKPRLTPLDRSFWVVPFRFGSHWRDTLVIVKPDTVIRWHRKGFRLYWRAISKRGPGRPPIPEELKVLNSSTGRRKWLACSEDSQRAREARLHSRPRNRLA